MNFKKRHLFFVFQHPEQDSQNLSCDHVQPWHGRVGHLSEPERLLSICLAALFKSQGPLFTSSFIFYRRLHCLMYKQFRKRAGCAWQKSLLLHLCKRSVKANQTKVSLKAVLENQTLAEWTLIWQQPSIRRSGSSHPPAGFIQVLSRIGLRIDWHLLASIVALKERLGQS